ncbi:MAG: FtsX-like permease family protein [Balneolaceae bacterium]|nr:FtsX-like permease family protein [Balneolaceae bacterium]
MARNKGYAFINIAGLAVALAVFMVIIFYIRHETSYEEHLPESDQVYRVLMHYTDSGNIFSGTPMGLAGHLEETYPEVLFGVKTLPPSSMQYLFEYGDRQFYEEGVMTATQDFFQVFSHTFLYGSAERSFSQPDAMVITESLARRLFGEENPIGETVSLNKRMERPVTGVVEDPPSNTHMGFKAVMRTEESEMGSWQYHTAPTYLKLSENSAAELERKFPDYIRTYAKYREDTDLSTRRMVLQPLSEIYLYPEGRQGGSDKMTYIRIFFAVALLILLIACVNYINQATARAMERTREIGVRKSVGASRFQVVQQVMVETALTCSIGFFLGLMLFEALLPHIQQVLGLDLSAMSWLNLEGVLILTALFAGVTLMSGAYCAFYMSGFTPKQIFQGQFGVRGVSKASLRRGLVVIQFAVSLVVILATVLISRQMTYIQENRMDGEDEQILMITDRSNAVSDQFDTFRQELLRNTSVEQVAFGNMLGQPGMYMQLEENELDVPSRLYWIEGSHSYLETLGTDLISGRFLSRDIDGDSTDNVLLNESAARLFGVEEARGQFVEKPVNAHVVGIVEDFHAQTFYERITPTVFRYGEEGLAKRNLFIRLPEGQISEGLRQVRETWDSFQTGYPFDYTFLDQELDSRYRAELRMASVFKGFAGFSIIISCLGLFGLAAFSARRRTKEIGIRKVLGATVSNIVALLSREFLLLVGLGFLVAVPIAYYGVSRWLQDFAYRIDLGAWTFVAVGAAVLLIALLTVSGQSIRAARANPADSLRTE